MYYSFQFKPQKPLSFPFQQQAKKEKLQEKKRKKREKRKKEKKKKWDSKKVSHTRTGKITLKKRKNCTEPYRPKCNVKRKKRKQKKNQEEKKKKQGKNIRFLSFLNRNLTLNLFSSNTSF